MRLNIWPWSRIRELEVMLEKTRELLRRTESACQRYEVELGNCAKEAIALEGENRRLSDRVNCLIDRNKQLNSDYFAMMDERNKLLDLLVLPPKSWKRRRVLLRRWLRREYRDFKSVTPYSVWLKTAKGGYKVYASEELPEPLGACPRCSHSDAELIRTEDGLHYVQCRKCGAMTDDCKHAEDAVQLWNEGRVLDE